MEAPIEMHPSPHAAFKVHQSPLHHCSNQTFSPSRSKRKRNSEDVDMENHSQQHQTHAGKRLRSLPIGRPLPLPRLLEGLDKKGLQNLLEQLCDRHPGLSTEVAKLGPGTSVTQALTALALLERKVHAAFPYGGDPKGEYAYNRVLPSIRDLLSALTDYVAHFLPPNEEHANETLSFVDGATGIISRLPDWHDANHRFMKLEAYEEIAGAWIQGFKEASKKGAGIGAVQFLHKLRAWNEVSGGALETAVQAANDGLAWLAAETRCGVPETVHLARLHPLQGLFSQ